MSADLILRAATKLRETATKATREPWAVNTHPELGLCVSDPTLSLCIQVEDGWVGEADLNWIALMSPALAEPLAVWLEFVANTWPFQKQGARDMASAVARAILGEVSA